MVQVAAVAPFVDHLLSPATLPKLPHSLSVMSYNVLLPNSSDGWWTYKMYNPLADNASMTSWDHRRSLLQERIGQINADVVCLQEVCPESFESDFAFMRDELGYDGVELFKKGRFRPATFWKTSVCQLVSPPVHKDRTLLTAFQTTPTVETEESKQPNNNKTPDAPKKDYWYVTNCHLQAGKNGPRRVRQIHEATRAVLTLARKLQGGGGKQQKQQQQQLHDHPLESHVRLIMTGDFNGGEESGAVRYLEDGVVDETFREDNEQVVSSSGNGDTKNKKELPFSKPLIDVAASATQRLPPATMVVSELMSTMMEDAATYDNPVLSPDMTERLIRVYQSLVNTSNGQMSVDDVKAWLLKINKVVGRGDEFRSAAKEMGWVDPKPDDPWQEQKKRVQLPETGVLTQEGFIAVYQRELEGGKFWGIAHDMAILGHALPDIGLYKGRYDRMYCTVAVQPIAVLDTVCDRPCPNDTEPSDHLPVAAVFQPATVHHGT